MYLIQILLPLHDAKGRGFPKAKYEQVATELTEKFGGVTAFTRTPAEGRWKPGGGPASEDGLRRPLSRRASWCGRRISGCCEPPSPRVGLEFGQQCLHCLGQRGAGRCKLALQARGNCFEFQARVFFFHGVTLSVSGHAHSYAGDAERDCSLLVGRTAGV
jgi:hypothetical protein